jgi:putative membrane protein
MERSASRNLWIGLGLLAIVLLVASSWDGGMAFGRGMTPFSPFGAFGPFGYRPVVAPWLFGLLGFGVLLKVLFFGLVFFLLFRLFRGRGYRRGYYADYTRTHDFSEQTPEEILRRRFAAGEISREQFEDMRRTLDPVA